MISENWLQQRSIDKSNHPALIFNNQVWTFLQLETISRQVTKRLIKLGVKPKTYIAFLADNSADLVILIHAVIKLNCVCIPLNTRLSAQELKFQIQDLGTNFLVYSPNKLQIINQLEIEPEIKDLQILNLKTIVTESETLDPALSNNFHSNYIDLNSTQTVIYTSGTTGFPKGVRLTYQNHLASAIATSEHLQINPDRDRWLNCLPLFHIGGLSIIWRSVILGLPMILLPKFDISEIYQAIATQEITFISLVPTMLSRILARPDFQNNIFIWQKLKGILLGGGAASSELINQCLEYKLPIMPTYGLTEAASQVTTLLTPDLKSKIGSSGRALSCNKLRIVSINDDQQELGLEAIGQILVQGNNVMKGYLHDSQIENNWLPTGDIGYLDADGYLYVLNRRSDLIISGGENIYPAEIEAILIQHPAILDACVIGITDSEWGQIVGAVVQVSDEKVNLAIIQNFCVSLGLARYKLPKKLYVVDSLPTTSNGKVSRKLVRELILQTE